MLLLTATHQVVASHTAEGKTEYEKGKLQKCQSSCITYIERCRNRTNHVTKDGDIHQHTLNCGCYKSPARMSNEMERLQQALIMLLAMPGNERHADMMTTLPRTVSSCQISREVLIMSSLFEVTYHHYLSITTVT